MNSEFPLKITYEITEKCNLNCKICYSIDPKNCLRNECSYHESILILNKLYDLNTLYVFLDGGEPLLRERFFDILEYCTSKFCTWISTNGTLIGATEAKKISELHTNTVFVSLHSHDELIHDNYTQTKGSYNDTLNGIKHLVDAGVSTMTSIVLSKVNYQNMYEYLLLCKDLKVNKINILRGYPLGINADQGIHLRLKAEAYADAIQRFESDCKKHGMKFGHSFGNRNHNCCGQAISIDSSGFLQNCPYLRKFTKLGNFIEDDPIELWNSDQSKYIRFSYQNSGQLCKQCNKFEYCRGGCTADKLLAYDSLSAVDPLCWIGGE